MKKCMLNGKWALVTGASSGIGKSTAELFAKLGCNLIITGRNSDKLNETLKNCHKNFDDKSGIVHAIICDLKREDDTVSLVKNINKLAKLDILINNAGILRNDTPENVDLLKYDDIMNINVRSIIHLSKLLIPDLIETKGCIVNVSGVTGIRAFPNIMSYCISKAALEQYTKCTAIELASKGVRVNAVCPGSIVTNLHKASGMNETEYKAFLNRCNSTHALGRAGNVDEISGAIAFLASAASTFITGVTLPIDGGRSQMCPR